MIEIEGLTKTDRHGDRVRDVTFVARPGKVTGLFGPNGAGKSTTLRILLGLDRATSGTALVEGSPYVSLRRPLKTVGAMLDGAGPVPERRGVDHLRWIAQSNGIPRSRVAEVLDEVGLRGAGKKRVGRYSLGMKQRLGLAVALLGKPRILILDEPINGLDPAGIRDVRNLIRGYAAAGNTVLLSSHLMAEAAETVDDIVILSQGRVTASGSLQQIMTGYNTLEEAFFAAASR